MVIDQRHSIGDLLFLEPMYAHFGKLNNEKPIVPVMNHLMWLKDYIDTATFIPVTEYVDGYLDQKSLDTMHANQKVRNLDYGDHSDFDNCMPDKYILAGLDPQMWKHLKINFNTDKAMRLYKMVCPEVDFILVNKYSQAGIVDIKVDKLPVVEMREIPGYTVLDWFFVMAVADEIHTVSTSTFYIFQAMLNAGYKLNEIFIYPRPNVDGLRGISKLSPDFSFTKMP